LIALTLIASFLCHNNLDLHHLAPASSSLIQFSLDPPPRTMKARLALVGLSVILATGCGAGTPQNETANTEAVLALGPMTTTAKLARQELADGVHELDMNRLEEAYAHFQRAIAADPNFALAEAYAYFSSQSQEAGYAHLERAIKLAAKASPAERLQIEVFQKNRDRDDEGALAAALKLVDLDRANPRFWTTAAQMYAALGQHDKSRAAYDSAIAHAPNYEPAYILATSSFVLFEPFDLVKAEQMARKAVDIEPTESDPQDLLGDALRAQGKLEEAGQAYTKCAELDSKSPNCLQQRGHVNTFLGHYPEARADYDAAVSLAVGNTKPGFAAYRVLVSVYEGDMKAAIAEAEEIYHSIDAMNIPDPLVLKIYYDSMILAIAEHAGMTNDAERAVNRRTALFNTRAKQLNSPDYNRAIAGFIALDQGYLALARQDYQTATAKAKEYMQIRASDRNPNRNRQAHDLLGRVALNQKRYTDAVKEFEQGEPDNIYTNYNHAVALEGAGRTAEAQKLYQKVAHYYFNDVGTGLIRKNALAKIQGAAG
jgi:tetratricopeptide (TPR) repeat protein